MTRGRAIAATIGITIAASYAVAAVEFVIYTLPFLRLAENPDALRAVVPRLASGPAVVLGLVCDFVIAGLVLGHLVHAIRAPQLPRARKALWVAALVLGTFVAVPFYWYYHVWRPAALAGDAQLSEEQRLAAFLQSGPRPATGGSPTAPGSA
jgi:hypothetical protein